MKISELQPKMGNVDITVEVVEKGDVREFQKFGNTGRVCNAVVKDDSGTVKLTLWNDDIDKVNVGDKITLTNGYVNEYQGDMQLTTGRQGKMEVVSSGGEAPAKAAEPEAEATPEPAEEVQEEIYVDEEVIE